jgi:hypothetical protein
MKIERVKVIEFASSRSCENQGGALANDERIWDKIQTGMKNMSHLGYDFPR